MTPREAREAAERVQQGLIRSLDEGRHFTAYLELIDLERVVGWIIQVRPEDQVARDGPYAHVMWTEDELLIQCIAIQRMLGMIESVRMISQSDEVRDEMSVQWNLARSIHTALAEAMDNLRDSQ